MTPETKQPRMTERLFVTHLSVPRWSLRSSSGCYICHGGPGSRKQEVGQSACWINAERKWHPETGSSCCQQLLCVDSAIFYFGTFCEFLKIWALWGKRVWKIRVTIYTKNVTFWKVKTTLKLKAESIFYVWFWLSSVTEWRWSILLLWKYSDLHVHSELQLETHRSFYQSIHFWFEKFWKYW